MARGDNKEIKGFPDEFASPSIKKTKEYGRKIALGIYNFLGEVAYSGSYQERAARFRVNEHLALGKQGADQYKPVLGDHEGTLEFMHLFWKETNPLPKYVSLAIKLLTENKYKPIATSFDPTSKSEKDVMKAKMIGNLRLRQLEETMFKGTGISFVPKGETVPRSKEEVEIFSEMTFKSSLEIAMETAISCVLSNNDFDTVRRQTAKSLIVNKWAGRYLSYDSNGDIEVEHIPEERIVVPYSRDDYFKKRKWTGHIKQMTISELRMYNNQEGAPVYTDEELFKIAKKFHGQNGNGNFEAWNWEYNDRDQRWNNFKIDVLCFEFNTTIPYKWISKQRKDGGKMVYGIDAESNEGVNSENKEVIKRTRQVYYDGMWVLGSDKMLKYGLRKNMAFDNGNGLYDGEPLSRYIITAPGIYNMQNKSIAETAEPYIHKMHMAHLKFQQILSEIAPNETSVDVNALQGVMEGLGLKGGKPSDVMKMKKQLGVWFYRSKTSHGKLLNQKPIQEMSRSQAGQMQDIKIGFDHDVQQLEDQIGLNEVIAGTSNNQYESVSAQEIKLSASVKSISDINDALDWMDNQTLKVCAIMIQDTISRGDKIKGFEKAIGRTNVDIIKIQGQMGLAEFGIDLEFLPTKAQLERLDVDIDWALKQDTIRFEDAQFVRMYAPTNMKRAIYLMALRREEYKRDKIEEQMALSQQNGAEQQQSAQVAGAIQEQRDIANHERAKELALIEGRNRLIEDEEKHKDKMREIDRKEQHEKEKIILAGRQNLQNSSSGSSQLRQPNAFTREGQQ